MPPPMFMHHRPRPKSFLDIDEHYRAFVNCILEGWTRRDDKKNNASNQIFRATVVWIQNHLRQV